MNPFYNVGGLRPGRSVFNLNHDVIFDADMGLLYPILVEEAMPGDVFTLGNEIVIRFHQPLFAPLLHEVNCFVHYFFTSYRNLWHDNKVWWARDPGIPGYTPSSDSPGSWETFLSGGPSGASLPEGDDVYGDFPLPRQPFYSFNDGWVFGIRGPGGILDFLYDFNPRQASADLPNREVLLGVNPDGINENPLYFPHLAYSFIYNEYYRNQNTIPQPLSPSWNSPDSDYKGLYRRAWEKDYFTASLPWRQRGTTPALPVHTTFPMTYLNGVSAAFGNDTSVYGMSSSSVVGNKPFNISPDVSVPNSNWQSLMRTESVGPVQLTSASFDVSDLRLSFQTQKWLERNARGGVRYTEMLRAHWGVAPRDDRLDRPEYIGGTRQPVIFSEVLKTESADPTAASGSPLQDPQGHLAGHGISASRGSAGKYHVKEYGVIMGILSIMPRTQYQDGINRMWLRDNVFDYPWPEFMHLSERPIWEQEIMCHSTSNNTNRTTFGYEGMYDEYRYRKSKVHGNMRTTLDYWHLARKFYHSSGEGEEDTLPHLNRNFTESRPRKDIYPVPSMPGMIVHVGNRVRAVRPMPVIAEPGLIDHF